MNNNEIKQEFREDEVAFIRHWDKARNEWVTNVFPKVGGRLRLAHEQNEAIDIETEIYKYDENVAVVIGTCRTAKGCFKGIGMSSVARDQKIAPAILEMAETRSIARALRFAGFGVEYCSAEEVSHLESGPVAPPRQIPGPVPEPRKQIEQHTQAMPDPVISEPHLREHGHETAQNPPPVTRTGKVEISFQPVETSSAAVYRPQFKAYETDAPATADAPAQDNGNGNGNGKKQMSVKQFSYIKSYGRKLGYDLNALSQKSIEIFNRELPYLTVTEASTFIDHMQAGLFRSNNTAV